MNKYGWTEDEDGQIFIYNQEESIKPKNIVEKIDFESKSSFYFWRSPPRRSRTFQVSRVSSPV